MLPMLYFDGTFRLVGIDRPPYFSNMPYVDNRADDVAIANILMLFWLQVLK